MINALLTAYCMKQSGTENPQQQQQQQQHAEVRKEEESHMK